MAFDPTLEPDDASSLLSAADKYRQSSTSTDQLKALADEKADKWGVPRWLLRALIAVESGWNPKARGAAGEEGLTQITPQYHPGVNPWNPEDALDYTAKTLRRYYERFGNSWANAVGAWNAGEPAVKRAGGVPSYSRGYVDKILGAFSSSTPVVPDTPKVDDPEFDPSTVSQGSPEVAGSRVPPDAPVTLGTATVAAEDTTGNDIKSDASNASPALKTAIYGVALLVLVLAIYEVSRG